MEDRWIARRRLDRDAMADWSVPEWTSWWTDGLEIWFSEAPQPDRALAFAPVRVNEARDDLQSVLITNLRRLYPENPDTMRRGAELAREQRRRIEDGAVQAMRKRRNLTSETAAVLMLSVFLDLQARRLPDMVQACLSAIHLEWLGPGRPDELIAYLSEAVFEAFTAEDVVGVADTMESLLSGDDSYLTILTWCLRAYEDSPGDCIRAFARLWLSDEKHQSADVWQDVSAQLDDIFGRPAVGQAVRALASEESLNLNLMLTTEYLSPHYGQRRDLLRDLLEGSGLDPARAEALEQRGIEFEPEDAEAAEEPEGAW